MAELRPRPRVFTIPPGAPFLATLAEALLSGGLVPLEADDPLALAGLTVLLPTRRAVRAFRETMIARLGGAAAILPVIRPIGDIDEEDHLLDAAVEPTADRLALPPTISRLDRRLALTRLTLAWARTVRRDMLALAPGEALAIPASAADAARLAGNLARLLDDMETAGVPWDALQRLVPEDHARYFQITLDFLKIVAERWPAYVAEIGRVDPAVRRDTLIRAAAERLSRQPPPAPIVAAGSTGSIPATAALLKAIATLPNGAVVLPGLDRGLDEAGWTAIDGGDKDTAAHGHPQYGLKQLIAAIGIARDEVEPLAADPAAARTRFVSEAMRPAETVDAWVRNAVSAADALAGVDLIVARNEQEEATAIALAIREAVDKPETTVALVTPDRTIARRVAVELARWKLTVDDSAGAPLAGEPAGVFARLLAEVAVSDADPVKLLALLKHPHAAFGVDRALCRRAARLLEVALFRGHRLTGGVAGLKVALEKARAALAADAHVPMARRRLTGDDWRLAERLAERLAAALGPIEAAFAANKEISVAAATDLLLAALTAAASDETGTDGALWQGADGEPLATLLTGLIDEPEGSELAVAPAEYPFFLTALLEDAVVQRPAGADPRVHIWGTLEARLQSVDLLILGGLDEGVWPAAIRTDPWLSRAMRADIGLPPPERRLGLSAHDFAEAMAAPRVVVTRAEKRDGTPTVESRWLQRLRALAGDEAADAMTARGDTYVALARDIDWVKAENVRPAKRPEPRPPLAARPRRLPVTDIEILVRDPYAIYAKRVLKLEELESVGKAPDYALRGSLIHDALAAFTKTWTGSYDASAEDALIAAGRDALAEIEDFPDVHAIWSFRFAAMARWLVRWEAARDAAIAERRAEVDGKLDVPVGEATFTLTGRADRIDVRTDSSLDILDYKTGTPPSATQVAVGFAPQLGLEAAMAVRGAFDPALAGHRIETLAWIGLGKIGREEPVKSAVEQKWTTERVEQEVFAQFNALITAFNDPVRAYVSRARPMFETRYESPYDHLARVREWGLVESEEDLAWAGLPPRK